MACPRCSSMSVVDGSCQSCGIIVGKYRPPREDPSPLPLPPPVEPGSSPSLLRPPAPPSAGDKVLRRSLLALLTVAAVGMLLGLRRPSAPLVPGRPAPQLAGPLAPEDIVAPPPDRAPNSPPKESVDSAPPPAGHADVQLFNRLAMTLKSRRISAGDLLSAEGLLARSPDDPQVRLLVVRMLMRAGLQQVQQNHEHAVELLQRAARADPSSPEPHLAQMRLWLRRSHWIEAEEAARQALERAPRDAAARRGLGHALFRQDRNREARDVLEALLADGEDAAARALLQSILKSNSDEQDMQEKRLANFNVRYDGAEHRDVGREILRALERHYVALAPTFDHRIAVAVPVVLFSAEDYHRVNNMPAWAGGHYNQYDGRIRIPIGGLTTALSPNLDGTLIHELTHAFVHDIGGANVPREIHEGLAQYMEGDRIERRLDPEQRAALAAGQLGGVGGFYLRALALVEFLMARRGQGGMNDLLRAIRRTGNVDRAFQDVFGNDRATVMRQWQHRMRQQWGA